MKNYWKIAVMLVAASVAWSCSDDDDDAFQPAQNNPIEVRGSGENASLYTISSGKITADITDFGATLVRLYVPDATGHVADVVLGYDDVNAYATQPGHLGGTVGRNANRIKKGTFSLGNKKVHLGINNNANNLHSGPDYFDLRIWSVESYQSDRISFRLESPDGDQGFPGNAVIRVTYAVEDTSLKLYYDAVCDQDTVFNMTNHSYFNLAGHDATQQAMEQTLMMPARTFTVADLLQMGRSATMVTD